MSLLNYINQYQKGEKLKVQAKRRNDLAYMNELTAYLNKALNCFQWSGLPDTVDPRMLEMSAILNGSAMIARDKERGALFSLISVPDGSLTLYGYPAGAYGYGLNGYNKHFTLYVSGGANIPVLNDPDAITANAVLLKDNYLMYPLINYLSLYAERISDATRSIDVLARCLKSPNIIKTDPAGADSVKKVLSDIDSNVPYIVGVNENPYSKMESINTGASPEALKTLFEYASDLRSEADNLLGINSNPDSTKRERMLVDEVNANNEVTDFNIKARLKRREDFCKQVNELFSTTITVQINPALLMLDNMNGYNRGNTGGDNNDNDNDITA